MEHDSFGELKPGDRLPPERELMTIFNVSKASLREALQTLESYGHIKKKRGVDGGSVILPLLPDNGISLILNYLKQQKYTKEDLIEARLLIEPLIVELAARKIDEKGSSGYGAMAAHEEDYQVKGTSRLGWESNLVYPN
jgi:GntR family transcriptional repressor for pyruvate dehydrogenase complex